MTRKPEQEPDDLTPETEEDESRKDAKNTGFQPIESQEDLDRIIRRRLNGMRKSLTKDIREEIEAEIEAEHAEQQGEYKKLYEDLRVEHDKLKDELDARDLMDRKRDIARQHGIPEEFVDRLRGDTDEEIEADAKEVAKAIKPASSAKPTDDDGDDPEDDKPAAPDTDSGRRTPPRNTDKPTSFLDSYEFGKRR